jgi:hypothetical protein
MTRTIKFTGAISLSITLSVAQAVSASEIFFEEVQVLDTEPLYETHDMPEQAEQCGYEETWSEMPVDRVILGDARSSSPAEDLVETLRSESGMRGSQQRQYRCQMVTRTTTRNELTGYRVRFRYAGRIYERRMSEKPGDVIRIRVRVSAGEPHLLTRSDRQTTLATSRVGW